jgi:hypothetical protein
MTQTPEDAKLDKTYWRGMYLIALLLGVIVPIGVVTFAAWLNEEKVWRFQFTDGYSTVGLREGPLLLLGLVWSAATIVSIVGVSSAAWLAASTAARLGIDRSHGYLRSVFFLAIALGAVIPLAAIVAAGSITVRVPPGISNSSVGLLTVIWFGMIAVSIAGLFCAAWLMKSAGAKLRRRPSAGLRTEVYQPRSVSDTKAVQ